MRTENCILKANRRILTGVERVMMITQQSFMNSIQFKPNAQTIVPVTYKSRAGVTWVQEPPHILICKHAYSDGPPYPLGLPSTITICATECE